MKVTDKQLVQIVREELKNHHLKEGILPGLEDINLPGLEDINIDAGILLGGEVAGDLTDFLDDQWEKFLAELIKRSIKEKCIRIRPLSSPPYTADQKCVAHVAINILTDGEFGWNFAAEGLDAIISALGKIAGVDIELQESARQLTVKSLRKIINKEGRRIIREGAGDKIGRAISPWDEDTSELKQFSKSKSGRNVERAGNKIRAAGESIYDEIPNQTGEMSKTLFKIADFVMSVGDSLSELGSTDDEISATEALPTVSDLRQLIKAIQRLEK